MARDLFELEKGLRVVDENGSGGVEFLQGSAVPGGGGDTDAAPQGSLYQRTNGENYIKTTAGTGTDKWVRLALSTEIVASRWREEKVKVVTGDVAPASSTVIDLTSSPFGDDDNPDLTASDFAVDDHILFGKGGTPKLMRVSVVSSPNITVVDADNALVSGDNFIVTYYLPDSPDSQESKALVNYNGTDYVKLADVNWDFADGINLQSGYAASSGDITASDTVQSAMQKVDGNVDALTSAVGVSQGDTNMGTYTGSIISDNTSAKSNIQELETDLEALQTAAGISAEAVDFGTFTGSILTDNSTAKVLFQELETDLEALQTAVGIAAEAVDLGTFTGSIISDNTTVKNALQELETDLDAVQTLTGVAAESVDLGTFTGDVIPDSSTIKAALQALETAVEGDQTSQAAVTAAVTLDSVLVDEFQAVTWHVTLVLASDRARRISFYITAHHDGTIAPAADAATVDDSLYAKIRVGASFNHDVDVDLNGTGASQAMRLRIAASGAIDAYAVRVSAIRY